MTSALQNFTNPKKLNDRDYDPIPFDQLTWQQQYWVNYCALQGLVTNDDGSMTKMTIQECAEQVGVTRQSLYDWKKLIPNFEELVNERVMQNFDGARTRKVINSIYIAATVKLNTNAQALWMANQKAVEFRMPTQKVEHEAGNSWAALLNDKKSTAGAKKVEATVIDVQPST